MLFSFRFEFRSTELLATSSLSTPLHIAHDLGNALAILPSLSYVMCRHTSVV